MGRILKKKDNLKIFSVAQVVLDEKKSVWPTPLPISYISPYRMGISMDKNNQNLNFWVKAFKLFRKIIFKSFIYSNEKLLYIEVEN